MRPIPYFVIVPRRLLPFLGAALLLVTVLLGTGRPAAASSPARLSPLTQADTDIPLLLLHGFNDDCAAAWDKYLGQANTDMASSALDSAGYHHLVRVGYYVSGDNNTDAHDADPQNCDVNLQTLPAGQGENTICNDLYGPVTGIGTKDEHIDQLACRFAWYVYDSYTQFGKPVNVLAHSMGGLILRYAIGATDAGMQDFPPSPLWIVNAVTVATPHGGIGGWYRTAAKMDGSTNGVELDDMEPGSAFMNTIANYQKPQGWNGTRWALIGASDAKYDLYQGLQPGGMTTDGGNQVSYHAGDEGDGVVPTSSQMAMSADFKILYGVRNDGFGAGDEADRATQYEHEAGMPCYSLYPLSNEQVCFNGPYYLSDVTNSTTRAWTCAGCTGTPGGAPVTADRPLKVIATQLSQKAVAALPEADLVLRSSANGKYVTAELGGSTTDPEYARLRARADAKGAWESWTRVTLPTGKVALRSNANGLYVSAEVSRSGAENGLLRARSATIGPWELFDLTANSDGTYSLKSTDLGNQLLVAAELTYTGPAYGELRARSYSVGPWEELTTSTAAQQPRYLGVPDFNGYCLATGQGSVKLIAQNAYGWACSSPTTGDDAQAVCSWTFSTADITNRVANFNDPKSWQCWGTTSGKLGGVDWNAYCRKLGYAGAADAGRNNAYTWYCPGDSNGLDAQDACLRQYGSSPAISRFQNFYDKNSWECWK